MAGCTNNILGMRQALRIAPIKMVCFLSKIMLLCYWIKNFLPKIKGFHKVSFLIVA